MYLHKYIVNIHIQIHAYTYRTCIKVCADIHVTYLPTYEHMLFIHICVYTHARYITHVQKFMKASFPHVNICICMYTQIYMHMQITYSNVCTHTFMLYVYICTQAIFLNGHRRCTHTCSYTYRPHVHMCPYETMHSNYICIYACKQAHIHMCTNNCKLSNLQFQPHSDIFFCHKQHTY